MRLISWSATYCLQISGDLLAFVGALVNKMKYVNKFSNNNCYPFFLNNVKLFNNNSCSSEGLVLITLFFYAATLN